MTFLSPWLMATNPVQTQGKMCHQLSSPRDVLAQGPELCPHQLCCGWRSQLRRWSPAVPGQPAQRAPRGCGAAGQQPGRQGTALCAPATAAWLWDCGRRVRAAWLPVASAGGAAASFPGSRCRQAACLRWAGQRGPLTINCPDLPCCPSDEDVCPGAVSERGSSTGRGGCSPAPQLGAPSPGFLSAQGQGAVGVGVQRAQRQQRDVPGVLGSQGTAASLPSHLENLIHANYAEKSSSDNEYEMEA